MRREMSSVETELSKKVSSRGRLAPTGAPLRALAAAAMLVAAGCSTTLPANVLGDASPAQQDRAEIAAAAARLAETPWPKADAVRLVDLFAKGLKGSDKNADRRNAADRYVDLLADEPAPINIVLKDAQATLQAADALALRAEAALGAIAPTMADVAVLERAIQQVRECRAVYLQAIEVLSPPATEGLSLTSLELKGRFDAAAIRISRIADVYADRAAADSLDDAPLADLDRIKIARLQ